MCCKKEREWSEDQLKDGAILENRHCTDCPCIIFFLLFLVGWFVILGVAVANGRPNRILLPTNYRGDLCGDAAPLTDLPNLFIPLPNRLTYGICVNKCPPTFSFVCNNDIEPRIGNASALVMNTYYDHTKEQFDENRGLLTKCAIPSVCTTAEDDKAKRVAGLMVKLKEYKCFPVFYKTSPTLNRCLPFDLNTENKTLLALANESTGALQELADVLGAGSFFVRGFAEVKQCWITIAICCATACVLSFLWVLLLRWILAPIVVLCILLIFALLIVVGILAMLQANNLENVKLPGESEKGTSDQLKLWRAVQYTAFLLAAIYVVVVIIVQKRIRIAIILMEESSKAFGNNPGLMILPVVVLVILMGFLAMFVVTTLYIQTIGTINAATVSAGVVSVFGETAFNASIMAASAGAAFADKFNVSTPNSPVNVSTWNTSQATKALHAYNFFGFLWIANFAIMFSFFVMAMVVVTWYFSATGVEIDQYDQGNKEVGRVKTTKAGTLCRTVFVAIRYHLGTILFGALLIAIIQFIRAVMLYIEREFLQKYKDNVTVKVLVYVINCCLECIERLIRIISRSAFVITCVKNTTFCSSAIEAMGLLLTNIVRVGTLQVLSTAAVFALKCFIVGCNMIIGFGLLRAKPINDDREVESGLFPMMGILIISFIISSLFMNVFESCVDTIMICFFIDEKDFEAKFMPPTLAKLVDQFKHIEEARRKYEESITAVGVENDTPKK